MVLLVPGVMVPRSFISNLTQILTKQIFTHFYYSNFIWLSPLDQFSWFSFTQVFSIFEKIKRVCVCLYFVLLEHRGTSNKAKYRQKQTRLIFSNTENKNAYFRSSYCSFTRLFTLFDVDSNGRVNRDEMKNVLSSMYKIKQVTTKTPDQHVDEIFKKLDKNKDGCLSLNEFLSLGNTDPKLVEIACSSVTALVGQWFLHPTSVNWRFWSGSPSRAQKTFGSTRNFDAEEF